MDFQKKTFDTKRLTYYESWTVNVVKQSQVGLVLARRLFGQVKGPVCKSLIPNLSNTDASVL